METKYICRIWITNISYIRGMISESHNISLSVSRKVWIHKSPCIKHSGIWYFINETEKIFIAHTHKHRLENEKEFYYVAQSGVNNHALTQHNNFWVDILLNLRYLSVVMVILDLRTISYLLTYSITHSFTHSINNHLLTHSLTHLFTQLHN